MSREQVLKLITEFMKPRYQMVLATYGDDPWIATLYYSFDNNLNIYFLSSPETLHCQHIATQPKVAVSIADSPQKPASKKKGVQIYGLAEQISDKQKIIHALSLWRKTLQVTSEIYTYEGMMKKLIDGRMYKVTPKKLKFFNQEIWEEGEEPVIEVWKKSASVILFINPVLMDLKTMQNIVCVLELFGRLYAQSLRVYAVQ